MPVPAASADRRAGCQVQYLTSIAVDGTTAHFFYTLEAERVVILADDVLGTLGFDAAAQRCVDVSMVHTIIVPASVMDLMTRPGGDTPLDELMRRYAVVDVVRLLGAFYRPASGCVPVLDLTDPSSVPPVAQCRRHAGALKWAPPPAAPQKLPPPVPAAPPRPTTPFADPWVQEGCPQPIGVALREAVQVGCAQPPLPRRR
eukprot:TRINITY_DN8818_c0_g1_i2.p2 TRINITY_DN8818_c0_g1~~TRINITY_DN8818_c0_g1_i2.p2  ORF type:complete len:201 (+),score=55.36 TRINITY_DN8818_c0_g1_i2:866-1468(+)